ncbi:MULTISPECIES: DUF4190 domain-containing protein [unclassified Solwaraspora]|uniref:DUF4190 domain-containing protein n=1 Tax=unclassified Solwaraspora TaxID=2627926 RepID=UPI00248AADEF|nr:MULTISPECIES: DUF4190 domain-containing protein [unclassified Solwaraspora]WBB97661.1 DUF4190 domain-containing protein [Solwaraspora sp. WMMA2059]WBC18446.1 DUF4190 domain-containing protein [Solwaraspora sp. WMMA2080]WJK34139.1 DUF4190 domain-containing protein [Solwaraspora sp. WMMA2065]
MKEPDVGGQIRPPAPQSPSAGAGPAPADGQPPRGELPPPGQYPPPGNPAGGYPYGGYPYGYVAPQPTNSMALASFIVSLVSLFSCPLLGGIAVYLGRRGRDEIHRTGQQGDGLAQAGVIIGWCGVGFGVLIALFTVVYFGFIITMLNTTAGV